jgi:hypothetical protein
VRAIDEMTTIGIHVRFASHPDLDPSDPDDRLYLNILFGMARRESRVTAKRVVGGMVSKLLKGDWPFMVPDGYINREAKLSDIGELTREEYLRHARYKRWVEIDAERADIWRYAWELLVTGSYTLDDICKALAERGYRRRNGKPFIGENKQGFPITDRGTLTKTFHNWFYAGWIVVDNNMTCIPPKTLRGNWEAIVTTEMFEQGLMILAKRDHKPIPHKKHFYLLQGMVYLERANGHLVKLSCGRPNCQRTPDGVTYYCIPSSAINFPCHLIDAQIAAYLAHCQVATEHIPHIRKAYVQDVKNHLSQYMRQETVLAHALQRAKTKELNLWRAFTEHGMNAEHYSKLAKEYQQEQYRIQLALIAIQKENQDRITNLDEALAILAGIGERYVQQSPAQQREILRHMVWRVIVNEVGSVLKIEFLPPFTYLQAKIQDGGSTRDRTGNRQRDQNKTSNTKAGCSFPVSAGGPEETRTLDLYSAIVALSQLSYRPLSCDTV